VTVAEPKQLDAAVRLVLSGPKGTLLSDSWPDLWDTAHHIVRSADSEDLWQSLCRLGETFEGSPTGVVTLIRPDDYEYPSESSGEDGWHEPTETADAAATTDFIHGPPGPESEPPEGISGPDREVQHPQDRARTAGHPEGITTRLHPANTPFLLSLAIILLALGAAVATFVVQSRPPSPVIAGLLRDRAVVGSLLLAGFALIAWAAIDWASSLPRRQSESQIGRDCSLRRAVPFAAATLVAVAGVVLLRSSAQPGAAVPRADAVVLAAAHPRVAIPGPSQAVISTPPSLSATHTGSALPVAANIVIQAAGLIRPLTQSAAQLSKLTPTASPLVPTPALSLLAPATQARIAAPPPEPALTAPTDTSPPPIASAFAAATPGAPLTATPFTSPYATPAIVALSAPQLLQPTIPSPPFALHQSQTPIATAESITSSPTVAVAANVRSTLPNRPSVPPSASSDSADAAYIATVAAAGPTAAGAHLRFGTPPPSPR
jgi:hypothetical protein